MVQLRVTIILVLIGHTAYGQGDAIRLRPVDGPTAYLGQAIRLNVASGCAAGAAESSWRDPKAPAARDFAIEGVDDEGNLVIVAQRAGRLRLPELAVKCRGGEADRVTAPLMLTIREVPLAGRPAGYQGGVGPLEIAVDIEPRAIRLGDSVEMRVRLTGAGVLGIKEGVDITRWLSEEDFLRVEARTDERSRQWLTREWSHRLRPARAGRVRIPSLAVATFDPDARRFVTTRSEGVTVEVIPLAEWQPSDSARFSRDGPGWLWVTAGTAGLLAGVGFGVWHWGTRTRGAKSVEGRTAARDLSMTLRGNETTDEAARVLLRALGHALSDDVGVLGADEVRAAVESKTHDTALARQAADLVRRLETLAYSNQVASGNTARHAQMDAIKSEAEALVRRLRNAG